MLKDNTNYKVRLNAAGNLKKLKTLSGIIDFKVNGNIATFSVDKELKLLSLLKNLPNDIDINEISIEKPSLHEIFVKKIEGGN